MVTYHKELYTKKNEMKKKELLAAVENSSKTYEEVLLPIMPGEKPKPEFFSE